MLSPAADLEERQPAFCTLLHRMDSRQDHLHIPFTPRQTLLSPPPTCKSDLSSARLLVYVCCLLFVVVAEC